MIKTAFLDRCTSLLSFECCFPIIYFTDSLPSRNFIPKISLKYLLTLQNKTMFSSHVTTFDAFKFYKRISNASTAEWCDYDIAL